MLLALSLVCFCGNLTLELFFCDHLPLGFLLLPFVAEALFVNTCRWDTFCDRVSPDFCYHLSLTFFFDHLLQELFLAPCVARLFVPPFVALPLFVIVCRWECFGGHLPRGLCL